jgi:flagellar protein FliO/FliZ
MDLLTLALRVVLSLAFVVLVLWYIQKRASKAQRGSRAGDPLTVISRRGLGKASSVVVVETDGKRFLLGVTEQSVNILHTSDAPDPAPRSNPATANIFALKLAGETAEAPADGEAAPEGTGEDGQSSVAVRRRHQRRPSPLDGSILSAGTWKQASAAIRKGILG